MAVAVSVVVVSPIVPVVVEVEVVSSAQTSVKDIFTFV